jgi:hypothetical protein
LEIPVDFREGRQLAKKPWPGWNSALLRSLSLKSKLEQGRK